MLRGEIRLVDLDPARFGEADKRRRAVIVSNDGANNTAARLGRGVITVIPVTTNVQRVYPFQSACRLEKPVSTEHQCRFRTLFASTLVRPTL